MLFLYSYVLEVYSMDRFAVAFHLCNIAIDIICPVLTTVYFVVPAVRQVYAENNSKLYFVGQIVSNMVECLLVYLIPIINFIFLMAWIAEPGMCLSKCDDFIEKFVQDYKNKHVRR